jgi:C-terminal processing protease CtpA/Prc
VLAAPRVRQGETGGPVLVELSPVAPGEDPRVELAGIGAGLEKKGDVLRITMVAPAGGAAEVGLAPGDEVLAIDGVPVKAMTLGQAIPLIRGPEGTVVTLLVVRGADSSRTAVAIGVPRRLVRT